MPVPPPASSPFREGRGGLAIGDGSADRVAAEAMLDYPCPAQSPYVRRLYAVPPFLAVTHEELYSAEHCGRYQVYKLDRQTGTVSPLGVDIFNVADTAERQRIMPLPSFSERRPPIGTRLVVVSRRGRVCEGRVETGRGPGEDQEISGCDAERGLLQAAVAIPASAGTSGAKLTTHWMTEAPKVRAHGGDPVAAMNDGSESRWRAVSVVDLTGEGERSVAVYCRQEQEDLLCERFLVQGGSTKGALGIHFLVSRVRIARSITE